VVGVTHATIETLRSELASRPARPTRHTMRRIVEGVRSSEAATVIGAAIGFPAERVVALVAELGTWLAQVKGKAEAPTVVDGAQMSLFGPGTTLVVPEGFGRRPGLRRDVTAALAAITYHDVSDDDLARFVSRRYRSRSEVLTILELTGVHLYARLGRLEGIVAVSTDETFRSLVVTAYDLLESSRAAAVAGVRTLIGDPDTPEMVLDAAKAAEWLAPVEFARLARTAELAITSGDDRSMRRELRFLRQRVVEDASRYNPRSVGDISEGQVRLIAVANGIDPEGPSRTEELRTRDRLKDMGFRSDLDHLVPEWVRAKAANADEVFWSAMDARLNGDATWAEQLSY
jgi:hypothetical protein